MAIPAFKAVWRARTVLGGFDSYPFRKIKGGIIKPFHFLPLFIAALLTLFSNECKGQSDVVLAPKQCQIDFRKYFGEVGSYQSPRAFPDVVVFDDKVVIYYSDKLDECAVYNGLDGTIDSTRVHSLLSIDHKLPKPFAYLPSEIWTKPKLAAWTSSGRIAYSDHNSSLLLATSGTSLSLIDFDLHSVVWSNPFNPLGLYRLPTQTAANNHFSRFSDTIVWVLHNSIFFLHLSTGIVIDSFTLDPYRNRDSWDDSYYGTFANAIFPKSHGDIPVFLGGMDRYQIDRLCVYNLDSKKCVWKTESPYLVHDWNDSLLVYVDTLGSLVCRNFLRGTECWKVTAADKIMQLCMKSNFVYFRGKTFGCVRVLDGVTIWTDPLTGPHKILSTGSKKYIGLLRLDPNSLLTTGISLYRNN